MAGRFAGRCTTASRVTRLCIVAVGVAVAGAVATIGPAAVASTGPGTVLPSPTPVAPVIHRGYPCLIYIGGAYDQYIYVSGQTPQTRVGAADVYDAVSRQRLWHRGLSRGYTVIHTGRGQVASSYIATINGIRCGPPA